MNNAVSPVVEQVPTPSYPAIRTLLSHRSAIAVGTALAVWLLCAWLGFRLAMPELYVAGAAVGGALWFVVRVAVEVVELVADTLMPR